MSVLVYTVASPQEFLFLTDLYTLFFIEQLVLTQGISTSKTEQALIGKNVHVIKFQYSQFLKPLYRMWSVSVEIPTTN